MFLKKETLCTQYIYLLTKVKQLLYIFFSTYDNNIIIIHHFQQCNTYSHRYNQLSTVLRLIRTVLKNDIKTKWNKRLSFKMQTN